MRALLSVWDKSGIQELSRQLASAGLELISTGGTYREIQAAGVPVHQVSDVTGFPELIDGRVKTLHPAIHGAILGRRDLPEHRAELEAHGIIPIDLVVANLYPFHQVVSRPGASLEDALEHIDIGGPAMIRAAAKNFPGVIVVVDPNDYAWIGEAIADGLPSISLEQRRALSAKAFAHVAAYDSVIARYLAPDDPLPDKLVIAAEKVADLRYGENPHQIAAFYRAMTPAPARGAANWRLRGGKDMSFNNYLDAQSAIWVVEEFAEPAIVIVKHNNPCGAAAAVTLTDAYLRALESDPVSAFGGIVAANRPIDLNTANQIASHFYEVVLAPAFEAEALERLRRKKNLRLIEGPPTTDGDQLDVRGLDGAYLVQTPDRSQEGPDSWRCVSDRQPTDSELEALGFAWRVVRHVKSNAIVMARGQATVGIGGGQPNRVDAVNLAIERAGDRSRNSVLASDAFFPFADGLEAAARAGVTAVVQPGGSVRDDEVIAAANAADIAMLFTDVRHFRH